MHDFSFFGRNLLYSEVLGDEAMEKQKTKYSFRENLGYMLKDLHNENKKFHGKIYGNMLCHIIPNVLGSLFATVMLKILIDSVTGTVSLKVLGLSLLVFVLLNIIMEIMKAQFEYGKSFYDNKLRYGVYHRRLIQKNLSMNYSTMESYQTRKEAYAAKRITSCGDSGISGLIFYVSNFFMSVFGITAFIAILTLSNPLLILIVLVSTILTIFLEGILQAENNQQEEKGFQNIYKRLSYLSNQTTDLKSAKEMRVFNMMSWFQPLYNLLFYDYKRHMDNITQRRTLLSICSAVVVFLRDIAVFAVLLNMYRNKSLTAGDFAFSYVLISGATNWVCQLSEIIYRFYNLHILCDDYRKYLDEKNDQPCKEIIDNIPIACKIEFRNVSFSYDGKRKILDNISFTVNPNEKIALVGLNGAGKSTMMKLLLGFYQPTSGKILINNKDIKAIDEENYMRFFSAVFQDVFTLPMSIRKNIVLNENVDEDKLQKVMSFAGISEKINTLPNGIDTKLHKDINSDAVELSGGELQRLLLARCIYKDAPIMILDEPTAALDPIAENDIYTKYNEISKNRTSFFISHRLASTSFCDRVLFLKDGKITESGTHEELMANQNDYYKLYRMQSYYYNEKAKGGVMA